ncbi:hypothetical protein N0V90_011608 [Kalmusia sp. IMI 367209]|nr:hypothetical protein N0V90_011608 [Kalmusia sp. IMI 367209]
MVKIDSILAFSALGMGALAHPTNKHLDTIKKIDKRICSIDENKLLTRSTLQSRADIPAATTWDPPSSMTTGLDQVWARTLQENPNWSEDKNWILDQLVENNGSINYCVRWNTAAHKSTASDRTKITNALQRNLQKWFNTLVGFEGFPLTTLDVKVVGYATKDKSLIEGDTSDISIYTTVDGDGVPECDPRCYRAAHLDGDLSGCPNGESARYDISLWLDQSLEGQNAGYGYNWGQELAPDYVLNNLDEENIHIMQHEMGHGFGLLDFYDWVPEGQTSFVMMAGSALEVTEFDAWMLRDWWRKLKATQDAFNSKNSYPWGKYTFFPSFKDCLTALAATLQATGNIGKHIVPALLRAGFTVTVISRPGSQNYHLPVDDSGENDHTSVQTTEAAYDDEPILAAALQHQDALIEAFNPVSVIHQRIIVHAALAAGVKHLITPEFGTNSFAPSAAELPSALGKIEAQRILEEELTNASANGKHVSLAWTGIVMGVFFDWAMHLGSETFFWVNPAKRVITRYGSGNQRTCWSHISLAGDAVVAVLQDPQRFKNRSAYFASYAITTNELIAMIDENRGGPCKPWEIVNVPDIEGLMQQGLKRWEEDKSDMQGFVMQVVAAIFDENNYYEYDFAVKVEEGWMKTNEELKKELGSLVGEISK